MEFKIEKMDPGDSIAAVSLVRAGLPAHLQPYMTLAQEGADAFMAESISFSMVTGIEYLAVRSGPHLVGFAEYASTGIQTSHLSQMFVSELFKRRGIAAMLLQEKVSSISVPYLELDVFIGNRPAIALYEKFGFQSLYQKTWWKGELPARVVDSPHLFINGAAQSNVVHRMFGSSYLHGSFCGEPFLVGRIGSSVFRLSSAEDALRHGLLASLRGVFPGAREWLFIQGEADAAPAGDQIDTALRMRRDSS